MNDPDYHRTFQKFSMGIWPVWTHNKRNFNYRGQDYHRQEQEDAYARRVDAFYALQQTSTGLNKVRVMPRPGQDFESHATEWEDRHSALTSLWRNDVEPIVDENYTVVGHRGWFRASEILIPKSHSPTIDVQSIVDTGDPVFANYRNPMPSYFNTCYVGAPEWSYLVVTSIDGAVLAVQQFDVGHGARSTIAPWEVLSVGKLAATLGAGGLRKVFKALISRKSRRSGAPGPTRDAAQSAGSATATTTARPPLPKGVIHGNPPQVSIGAFGEAGNLMGSVQILGNKVVYNIKAIVLKGDAAKVGTARAAHREMIKRTAEEARKRGQSQFTLRGEYANPNFQQHANKLAREIGVPNSGKAIPTMPGAHPHYEVTLDVAKALAGK